MKVLHVITSLLLGGAEKLLVDSLPLYKKQGVEVEVYMLNNTKGPFYEILANKHNIKIHCSDKSKSVYDPKHILAIRKLIPKFDIIHVHLFPCTYFVPIGSFFIKSKIIYTEHSTENRRRKWLLFKWVDKILYKKYDRIFAISNGVKANLLKHLNKRKTEIQVISNGINVNDYYKSKPSLELNIAIPENSKIIIQVSNFSKQKDQNTLIKALTRLPENNYVVFVGDGVLIDESKKLVEFYKLQERVLFLGYRSDVPALLKASDVCVQSSHYEGFGLSCVEAMASNIPVVASKVSGLSEIVGDYGVLFAPSNDVELADQLHRLLEDRAYYEEVRSKCLDRANDFTIEVMVTKYIREYKLLLVV